MRGGVIPMKRTTIKDVAKLAGVSTSTVSLVLNEKPVPISAATRAAVLEAANTLNYRPNQLAVGLVTSKSNSIGLIIPDNSNPFFASLSNYIEKEANQNGFSVILGNTNNDPKSTRNYLQIFADHQVDGIILAQADFTTPEESEECMKLIQELRTPVVLVDRVYKDLNIDCVLVDQVAAGYLATHHLLELGHRKIGCASGPLGLGNCSNRLAGYKKALEEFGIDFDPALVYEDNLNIECGIHALPSLLGHNVTAIFAFNDLIAYGIYKESRNYSLSIPEDLSVVGLDDIFLSEIIQPPLTTVAQPIALTADIVVKKLLDLMLPSSSHVHTPKILQPTLKVRGSTRRILADSSTRKGTSL